MNLDLRESVTTAIIDGKEVYYDACSSTGSDAYRKDVFLFIGIGCINTIDGIQQNSKELLYFFKRIEDGKTRN